VQRYKSLNDAKENFDKLDAGKYSKILVDGTTGKIREKSGDKGLVGQNLVYMYEHI